MKWTCERRGEWVVANADGFEDWTCVQRPNGWLLVRAQEHCVGLFASLSDAKAIVNMITKMEGMVK